MDALRNMRRRRALGKAQTAAGLKSRRHGARAGRPNRRMALAPNEEAAAHQLMAEDAAPNLRVWQMWDEACGFESELGVFRHNLGQFEAATDAFLARLEPILRAPLPRVWDAVEGGLAEPTRATISHGHQHTVGGDVSIAGFEEARSEFHNRLRGHILRPLHQWSEALNVVEERLPELNRLRGVVVKRSRAAARRSRKFSRRAAAAPSTTPVGEPGTAVIPYPGGGGGGLRGLLGACAQPHTARHSRRGGGDDYEAYSDADEDELGGGYGGGGGGERRMNAEVRREMEAEEAGLRLNYEHRQLAAARDDYAEVERLLADQLSGLVRDAAWLKAYAIASLNLNKEAMQVCVVSLGNTKQPLPCFASRSPLTSPHEQHGILMDNFALAAALPEPISPPGQQLGGPRMPGAAVPVPAALPPAVHAHRATALPMELAARPDVWPLDRVATAPRGAAAIPLSAVEAAVGGMPGGAMGGGGYGGSVLGGRRDVGTAGVASGGASAAMAAPGAPAGAPALTARQEPALQQELEGGRLPAATQGGGRELGREPAAAGFEFAPPAVAAGAAVPSPHLGGAAGRAQLREAEAEAAAGTGAAGRGGGADLPASLAGERDVLPARDQGVRAAPAPAALPAATAAAPTGAGVLGSSSAGMTSAGGAGEAVGNMPALQRDASPVVCSSQRFTQVEDRPVVRERVTRFVEHAPVEKTYEASVTYVGEQTLPGSVEAAGPGVTRVVAAAEPGPKCPTGAAAGARPIPAPAGVAGYESVEEEGY